MHIRSRAAALVLCLLGGAAAQAIPITYDVTFSSTSGVDSSGAGSFVWDDDGSSFSNFVWDLAAPFGSGGVPDTFFGESGPVPGVAEDLAEILIGIDTSPSACTTGGCGQGIGASWGLFGLKTIIFQNFPDTGVLRYAVQSLGGDLSEGTYSTVARSTSVPEPGTLALFGLGLAALRFARRRAS
jgi:hypothetical protein